MDKGQLSTAYILYISNQLYTFDLVALTDNSRIGAFFSSCHHSLMRLYYYTAFFLPSLAMSAPLPEL